MARFTLIHGRTGRMYGASERGSMHLTDDEWRSIARQYLAAKQETERLRALLIAVGPHRDPEIGLECIESETSKISWKRFALHLYGISGDNRPIEAVADGFRDSPRQSLQLRQIAACKPHDWKPPVAGDSALECRTCGKQLPRHGIPPYIRDSIVNSIESRRGTEVADMFRVFFADVPLPEIDDGLNPASRCLTCGDWAQIDPDTGEVTSEYCEQCDDECADEIDDGCCICGECRAVRNEK